MNDIQQAWSEANEISDLLTEYRLLLQRFDHLTGLGDQGGNKYYGDRVFHFHLAAIRTGIDSRLALQVAINAIKYDIDSHG